MTPFGEGFLQHGQFTAVFILITTSIALTPLSASALGPPVAPDIAQLAQDLSPKGLTNPTGPAAVPAPSPGTNVPGNPASAVVPHLDGLVFVPSPDKVTKSRIAATGVVLEGVTVPDEPAFRDLVNPYLGRPLKFGDLNRMKEAIVAFYRDHDRPIIDVQLPPQDATNGVVQLVLLEGRVGQVNVKGNEWFSTGSYRDALRLQPGDPIRNSTLQSDLDWINQNPFREATVVFSPGATTGDTDITIQAKDRFPLRVYASYDDSGTALTGFDRYSAGFNWGNVFGLGQQLNYQFSTSSDARSFLGNSASYVIPLPWRDTLTFAGDYVDTHGVVPPFTAEAGNFWDITARYAIQLPRLADYRQQITAGFDFKHNRNALQFGGIPVSNTPSDVDQFVVGYKGDEKDGFGRTSLNLQLFGSPGGLMGDNDDAHFAAVRTFSRSEYVYGNLVVQRLTQLPADFSFVLRGTGQLASTNLQPSEELGFGGYDSIRGYDEREVNSDNGIILTAELRSPTVSLGEAFGVPQLKDQLQFLVFFDYGAAYDERLIPGEPPVRHLASVGPGFVYTIDPYLKVVFDYGFQLHRTGFDNDHGSRGEVSVVVSY